MKTMFSKYGANFGVGLGDAFWMVFFSVSYHQIESHCIHLMRLRVVG